MDDLRSRLGELPRDRDIAAYCQVGQRGYLATRILKQAGFQVANIGGGYKTYQLLSSEAEWRPLSGRIYSVTGGPVCSMDWETTVGFYSEVIFPQNL